MSISFRKYVLIVSGVAAGAAVRARNLILRVFTSNEFVPTQGILEFTDQTQVGDYFGFDSREYKIAVFYFGWISKVITRAKKIAFAYYSGEEQPPKIFGHGGNRNIDDWTGLSNGSFTITINGDTLELDGLSFNDGPESMADIAEIIQQAIESASGDEPMWTSCSVTFNATTGSMDFVGGEAGYASISAAPNESGENILDMMGWGIQGVFSYGIGFEEPVGAVARSAGVSNDFGSFTFEPALDTNSGTEFDYDIAVAAWNMAENILYQYLVPTPLATAEAMAAALANYGGTAVTVNEEEDEFSHIIPGIILAATDYNRRASTSNYMYNQFATSVSVSDTGVSDTLDAARVNYYGETQQAGQQLAFYQRGVLMGIAPSPLDQNVYANEQWLKDAAGVACIRLLLALPKVSANSTGRGQVMGSLLAVIATALKNGTISIGKPFDAVQKAYITEQTDDELAWHQVQNIGYWLDAYPESYVAESGVTEWKMVYVLIYSKDDCIRKVEGSHQLI